jgi:hypothetical protein
MDGNTDALSVLAVALLTLMGCNGLHEPPPADSFMKRPRNISPRRHGRDAHATG